MPYISRLMSVAALVVEHGGDEETRPRLSKEWIESACATLIGNSHQKIFSGSLIGADDQSCKSPVRPHFTALDARVYSFIATFSPEDEMHRRKVRRHERAVLVSVFVFMGAGISSGAWAQTGGGAAGGVNEYSRPTSSSRPSRVHSQPQHARHISHLAEPVSQCAGVAGAWSWKWLNNSAVVVLNADGTSSATTGNKGTWTCAGRTVTVNWPLGPDILMLSSDGKILTGKGFMDISVVATRMAGP